MGFLSTFVSVLTLSALCVFGWYSMHSLIQRNGYVAALETLRDDGPHYLPESDIPLLTEYTGIRSIDYQLSVLQCVFAQITDGSAPALSLFSFYFAGQLVPVLAVVIAESYRSSQNLLFKFPLPWFLAMQLFGFGLLGPVWSILHLLFAPLNSAIVSSKLLNHPKLIINSIWAGYVFITVLNMYPLRHTNPILDQRLMAVWQGFPILLSLAQFIIGTLRPAQQLRDSNRLSNYILENTYLFAMRFAVLSHVITMLLLLISKFSPALYFSIPLLKPSVAARLSRLSFHSVFSPPNPFPPTGLGGPTPHIINMPAGIHGFLNWDMYVGMASLIVWSYTLMSRAKSPGHQGGFFRDIIAAVLLAVVGGPGGVLVGALMYRDWMLLEDWVAKKQK